MFSGIIEATARPLKVKSSKSLIRLTLKRPSSFKKLKEGESIAINGVCLTLEAFTPGQMVFAIGPETLKITKWTEEELKKTLFNLERSLTLESVIGGHLVTGHIDGLALVQEFFKKGESQFLKIKIPLKYKKFFWKKGYIGLNGLSLTINEIKGDQIEICLIPKTLKLTNMSLIKRGDRLNFEIDYLTRVFHQHFDVKKRSKK